MNKTRIFLIVATCLWVLAGFAGVVPAMFSAMMFDAPGPSENPATLTLFWSTFTFPLVCLVAVALGWILHLRGKQLPAVLAALAPLLSIAIGTLALLYLIVFNDGRFGN